VAFGFRNFDNQTPAVRFACIAVNAWRPRDKDQSPSTSKATKRARIAGSAKRPLLSPRVIYPHTWGAGGYPEGR
jgi:hypothetical protein